MNRGRLLRRAGAEARVALESAASSLPDPHQHKRVFPTFMSAFGRSFLIMEAAVAVLIIGVYRAQSVPQGALGYFVLYEIHRGGELPIPVLPMALL